METYNKKFMSFKEVFAYSFGLFGFQAVVGYLNSYQSEFYASTMGANIAIVGVLLLIAKVVSSIFDPFVGNIIERTNTKFGKLRPFILFSTIPLLILTVVIFTVVPFRGVGLYIYIFITYTLWSIAMTFGDIPSQGLGAVLTPNPTERTNIVSFANTLKSIGLSAAFVIVPIICLIVPGGAGFEGKLIASEYFVSAIVIGILGCLLFSLIFFVNKERVPYVANKMTFGDMWKVLKGNKPLLLIICSYFLGFARPMAMAIQIQAANALLGSANKILLLGITAAIGTTISMALVPMLVKRFNEKKVFIGMAVYGFVISLITFLVGFDNLIVMLIFLFFLGLQFGGYNVLPMVMTADCVDFYEYKTGKRTEGVAYAVLSFAIKISMAISVAVGLGFVALSGYDANATVFSYNTKNIIYFAYTLMPAITGLISIIPILFYDLIGDKKKMIVATIKERREKAQDNIDAIQ